ncbi:MAG: tyrosine-type recombinase/integrase [Lachnospiraceae bacterium]|nr:tyrosine-type recombinase/integrase [Lachnospiraceae bacterium]
MRHILIHEICKQMQSCLNDFQQKKLKKTLELAFDNFHISDPTVANTESEIESNTKLLNLFLASKKIEGCSDKTLKYYSFTLMRFLEVIDKNIASITTNDIRFYLSNYQKIHNSSKVTIDNIRRIFSSFFIWLENEDYIAKSPVRRIHKIKTTKVIKETLSDENLEVLREHCTHSRDLALVDLFVSTGVRVGELVHLNRSDINFHERECIVLGKGDKERKVYFDAKTKIHLQQYLDSREDDNPALFVTKQAPYRRLSIAGVEYFFRQLGSKCAIQKVHPHKFRRTMATMAINKGMPIEQVQRLLGHVSIDTTLHYAIVNQTNVKIAHQKYLC